MTLLLAERKRIAAIFFLNDPPSESDTISTYFSWESHPQGAYWSKYYYIKDKNRNLKWIFPESSKYPVFMALENNLDMISSLKKKIINTSFFLGIKKWGISGSFYVNHEHIFPLFDLINSVPHESFAILTNTTGKYRKSVIALSQGKYVSHFIKLAHTDLATELIYNEVYGLQILAQRRLRKLVHPFLSHTEGDHAIIISSVKPVKKGYQSLKIEIIHIEALGEIYQYFHHGRELQELIHYMNIESKLAKINEILQKKDHFQLEGHIGDIQNLLEQYTSLYHSCDQNYEVIVSLTHGDFIPSNMYLTQRQLHLYDWENMQESLPLLFDLFYFIYHTYVDLGTFFPPQIIREQIRSLIKRKEMVQLCEAYDINPWDYHKIYLLLDIPNVLYKHIEQSNGSHKQLNNTITWMAEVLSFVNDPG